MTTYITRADVDSILGAGWEGAGDATRAVLEANAWMTAKSVQATDPIESAILQAGAYLAQMAALNTLYADQTPALKRKKVDADGVLSEKEYQDGAQPISGRLLLINDMLRPYLPSSGSTFAVRRA